MDRRSITEFATAGMVAMVLPRAWLSPLQLSSDVQTYKRLRVPLLIRLTQDAPWIRSGKDLERRIYRNGEAIAHVIQDTWTRERFHLGLFVFCALCALASLRELQFVWCFTLLVSNTLYNLYPVWLQQYLRLRLASLLSRTPGS